MIDLLFWFCFADLSPCDSSEFQCTTNECIDSAQICDGYLDCADGGDEIECSEGTHHFLKIIKTLTSNNGVYFKNKISR